jgi:Na+-driven multidrug efflux pump
LVSESDYYNVDWGEIEEISGNLINQFTLDSSDTIGSRFTVMLRMSSAIICTNLRILFVELMMFYFLQYRYGFDVSYKELKGYAIAQGTIGMVILMPLYGLNSAMDTLVSQVVGSIGDQKMLELCGIYLIRGRYMLTLLYIPLLFIVMYSHTIWQFIFLVEDQNGQVVADQEAI